MMDKVSSFDRERLYSYLCLAKSEGSLKYKVNINFQCINGEYVEYMR